MKKIFILFFAFIFTLILFTSQTYAITSALNLPDDFIWEGEEVNVYYDKDLSKFVSDFIIEDHKIENAGVDYFVSKTGSDSNDGLTIETALASIQTALGKVDAETIYVDSGTYNRDFGFNGAVYNGIDVNIIGLADDVIVTAGTTSSTWTKTEGYTNIYNFSRTGVNDIRDSLYLDADGEWAQYSLVLDAATADTTPGSYYYDGTIVYIHPFESRAADLDIHMMILAQNLRVENSSIYLENIKIYGGALVFRPISSTVFMKDVEIKYASTYNGLQSEMSNVYSVNVEASHNKADGFNYHNTDPLIRKYVIEIDSTGHNNGVNNTTYINNGSSSHEMTSVIRVNGTYYGNKGPNVIDVGQAQSINYGTNAYSSIADDELDPLSNVNYAIDQVTEFNKMWLINAISSGSTYDYWTDKTNIFDLTYFYVAFVTNGGTALNDLFILDADIVEYPPLTGKATFTFGGWYLDQTLSNPFSFSTTAIESDTTLYARWVPQSLSTGIVIGGTKLTTLQVSMILVGTMLIGYVAFDAMIIKKGKGRKR